MSAPNVIFSNTGTIMSDESGYDCVTVSFYTDAPCSSFECRATKTGAEYGVGKGVLVASFSYTPANTMRSFDIYDDYLTSGDGEYRISLFAQGLDGSWNNNGYFIPYGSSRLITSDGDVFLSMSE